MRRCGPRLRNHGELAGRYREEGGIVSTERDLGFALELLVGVRNWANHQDIQDAVQQEREFYAQHPEARPRHSLSDYFPAETQAQPEPGAADWPGLHRRWADLADRVSDLQKEIVELEEEQKRTPGDRKRDRRIRSLNAERDRLINHEIDGILQDIFERPVDSWEAMATLLDIAIDNGDLDPPAEPKDLPNDWITFLKVLKALRQRAPAIEFTSLRRTYGASVDVEAIIANA